MWGLARDKVELDAEVVASFAEGGVGGFGKNHLGLRDTALVVGFVPSAQTGHEDRFCTAAGGYAYGAFRPIKERQNL